MDWPDHGSNSYNKFIEDELILEELFSDLYPAPEMSLKELNRAVDADLLDTTVPEILSLPAERRSAAIDAFAEIDPGLGAKLRLEVLFSVS